MQDRHRRTTTAGRILAITLTISGATLVLEPEASASGYLTSRFGADHGTPAMSNAYAIYFNPAALGGTKGTQLTGDLGLVLRWASYTRSQEALTPSDPAYRSQSTYTQPNLGNAQLANVLAMPFLGVSTDFGGSKLLHGGFATYVPFGGMATWERKNASDYPGTPGAVDGPQRWHNISGQILAIYNTAALAFTIPDTRLSLGASVSGIVHTVGTVRARNADGSDDTVTPTGDLIEGRSLLTASGFNLGAAFGLYWDPSERARLGLSYTSQPGFGTTKMRGDLTQQLGAASTGDVQRVDFLQSYPDIWRLGGAFRLHPKWELRTDFEYVRWSTFDKQCVVTAGTSCTVSPDGSSPSPDIQLNIPRKWKDAIGARWGIAHWLTDDVEVFGSVGTTTPAVPRETIDASTIDSLRFYFTAGARVDVSKRVALGASYNHIYFVPVHTRGRNTLDDYQPPSRSPSGDGTYKSQIGFINLNATYRF